MRTDEKKPLIFDWNSIIEYSKREVAVLKQRKSLQKIKSMKQKQKVLILARI